MLVRSPAVVGLGQLIDVPPYDVERQRRRKPCEEVSSVRHRRDHHLMHLPISNEPDAADYTPVRIAITVAAYLWASVGPS
jgi:hypothetical protein